MVSHSSRCGRVGAPDDRRQFPRPPGAERAASDAAGNALPCGAERRSHAQHARGACLREDRGGPEKSPRGGPEAARLASAPATGIAASMSIDGGVRRTGWYYRRRGPGYVEVRGCDDQGSAPQRLPLSRLGGDFLGLPLAHSLPIGRTRTGRVASVLHTFYRLGDGSFLAFFEEPGDPSSSSANATLTCTSRSKSSIPN